MVPRNYLINFNAGFQGAWDDGAPRGSMLDTIEYMVEFRRRRKPSYPGADQLWKLVMGEEPLPARPCARGGE